MVGLIRSIVLILILYFFYRIVRRFFLPDAKKVDPLPKQAELRDEDLVEDPYCHTYIPLSNAHRAIIGGQNFYFCSRQCLEKYQLKNG